MRKLGREISQATVFVGRLTAGLVVCRTSGSAKKTTKRDVRVERAVAALRCARCFATYSSGSVQVLTLQEESEVKEEQKLVLNNAKGVWNCEQTV